MCNEHTLHAEARVRREVTLSRRGFNLMALSAAAVAALPSRAVAEEVREAPVEIETSDGTADGCFVHPAQGAHAGVVLWPDYMGLRPAYQQLARKLAQSGYAVLVFNCYYRDARAPLVQQVDFGDKPTMQKLERYFRNLSKATFARDSKACIDFLDAQPSVDPKRKIGAMGYCMGGTATFFTAAAVPQRIGAIASFHGGALTTPEAGSPINVIPKINAQALVAIAANDDAEDPDAKNALRQAFVKAQLRAEVEVYAADHGWCTPDMTAYYNEAQARRAWERLLVLFDRALV